MYDEEGRTGVIEFGYVDIIIFNVPLKYAHDPGLEETYEGLLSGDIMAFDPDGEPYAPGETNDAIPISLLDISGDDDTYKVNFLEPIMCRLDSFDDGDYFCFWTSLSMQFAIYKFYIPREYVLTMHYKDKEIYRALVN